jgi:hypothetical protein
MWTGCDDYGDIWTTCDDYELSCDAYEVLVMFFILFFKEVQYTK